MTCGRQVYLIQHYVIKSVSDLWQARCTWYNIMWSSLSVTCGRRGVLDTTLCDQVCQWLVAGEVYLIQHYVIKSVSDLWQARCTWYNIMWSSLSVTCGRRGVLDTTLCDQVCQWLVAGEVYLIQHCDKVCQWLVAGEVYLIQHYVIKFVSDLWQARCTWYNIMW